MRLMREVRCSPGMWPDAPKPGGSGPGEARRSSSARACNSWAGSIDGDLRTFWVLRAIVEGPVDEETGFLCNIKQLDTVLLDAVVPHVHDAVARAPRQIAAMGSALHGAFAIAAGRCPAPASTTHRCPGFICAAAAPIPAVVLLAHLERWPLNKFWPRTCPSQKRVRSWTNR